MTPFLIFSVVMIIYAGLNWFVNRRIDKAYYLDEGMRYLHKKLIWFVPFLGPLMIVGFWRKRRKVEFDTMTKQQREKRKASFYESGIGVDSDG